MPKKPTIGITMGDAAGIGPEITVKALSSGDCHRECNPIVIGDSRVLDSIRELLDLCNLEPDKFRYGRIRRESGKASIEYIEKAVKLAMEGTINAITTAPISKEAINKAGYQYSGHTEILAELTGTRRYTMMLIAEPLKVVHVTTHIPLARVSEQITESRVLETIELACQAMKTLGNDNPKIGVAGLNPHSSDGGLFGDEEKNQITPAVVEARRKGINVEGPIPADTLFPKTASGIFDIAVAMYHDQGHIPIKLIGLEWDRKDETCVKAGGVNITIGLPIIRTSVDHGTAFDIAGKGIANPDSLRQAIEIAARMAEQEMTARSRSPSKVR
jgi:4-hydroxythreonine-4-phosphate dehydrogenase